MDEGEVDHPVPATHSPPKHRKRPITASNEKREAEPEGGRRKKRRKVIGNDQDISSEKTRSRVRGARRAAKLESFTNMPEDIFLEIGSHVSPQELLNMSRVSRQWREKLWCEKAKHVWVSARRNVPHELPDCPPDLSEPMYARLLFGKNCTMCGDTVKDVRAVTVDYSLRIRSCRGCWENNFKSGRNILVGPKWNNLPVGGTVYNLIPRDSSIYPPYFLSPQDPKRQFVPADNSRYHFYNIRNLERAGMELMKLRSDSKARKAYILKCVEEADKVMNHAEAIMRWERRCREIINAEKRRIAAEKTAQVYAKLRVRKSREE